MSNDADMRFLLKEIANMKEIIAAVEKHQQRILDAERYIWKHPETGYKEFKTTAYMAEAFKDLGYDMVMADGITGFYTVIDTGKPGHGPSRPRGADPGRAGFHHLPGA